MEIEFVEGQKKGYINEVLIWEFIDKPLWFNIQKVLNSNGIELQDNDEFYVCYEEPYYTENNSSDGGWFISVKRKRLETDDEYNKRLKQKQEFDKERKENQRKLYFRLKEQFEKGELD